MMFCMANITSLTNSTTMLPSTGFSPNLALPANEQHNEACTALIAAVQDNAVVHWHSKLRSVVSSTTVVDEDMTGIREMIIANIANGAPPAMFMNDIEAIWYSGYAAILLACRRHTMIPMSVGDFSVYPNAGLSTVPSESVLVSGFCTLMLIWKFGKTPSEPNGNVDSMRLLMGQMRASSVLYKKEYKMLEPSQKRRVAHRPVVFKHLLSAFDKLLECHMLSETGQFHTDVRLQRMSRSVLFCDNCGKTFIEVEGLCNYECSGCSSAFYCSRLCQKAAYRNHEGHCTKFSYELPHFPEAFVSRREHLYWDVELEQVD